MRPGESNIHQRVIGQQTIQKSLGVLASSFLEEEEFTHPQLRQWPKGGRIPFRLARGRFGRSGWNRRRVRSASGYGRHFRANAQARLDGNVRCNRTGGPDKPFLVLPHE